MEGYALDEHMISEGVKPIPRDLWLWGMKRRGHCLRNFEEDILKINLLPTETGRITNLGIKFKGIHYKCDQAIRDGWFADRNPRMGQELNIAFDPRFTDKVILKGYNGKGYQELVMVDPDHSAKQKSWDEFLHIQEVIDLEHEIYKETEEQAEAEKGYKRDNIVEMANMLKQESGLSKTKLIDGLAERTALEKEMNRAKEHFFNDDSEGNSSVQDNSPPAGTTEMTEVEQESKDKHVIGNARLQALLAEQNRQFG
jgi:putative transposase